MQRLLCLCLEIHQPCSLQCVQHYIQTLWGKQPATKFHIIFHRNPLTSCFGPSLPTRRRSRYRSSFPPPPCFLACSVHQRSATRSLGDSFKGRREGPTAVVGHRYTRFWVLSILTCIKIAKVRSSGCVRFLLVRGRPPGFPATPVSNMHAR